MQVFVYESLCAGVPGPANESLLREGRAMLTAIVADFQAIPDVEVVTLLDECATFELGGRCVRVSASQEQARFRELAGEADWAMVIAPEFGDMLRQRSQDVLDAGGRLLGSSPDAIALTGDKFALAQHWRNAGVWHPRTEQASRERFDSIPCPCVLKPRFGAGSQATFLVRDDAQKERIWREAHAEWPMADYIVQEYIAGQAASVAVLIGANEVKPLSPALQTISNDGRFRYKGGTVPIEPGLAERAVRIAKEAINGIRGLAGYVGVDLMLGEHDCVIEINPRLTTSYIGLRQISRHNLALALLRTARCEPIGELTWENEFLSFDSDGKVRRSEGLRGG